MPMNHFKKLSISFAVVGVALVAFASRPEAAKPGSGGGSYNCKSDKQIDVPMQFAVDVQSAGRVHVSAYGGSDKSGYLVPYRWLVYDRSGTLVDYFPKAILAFVSPNMLKQTNLEGLLPDGSYTIALVSQDFCNNQATVTRAVTMPSPAAEWNAPVLSEPNVVQTGGALASFSQINFSVTDDTGVQDVAVYVNGTTIFHVAYYNGVTYRWWCDEYPDDGRVSVLEGPEFYVSYPSTNGGTTASVEVVVTDVYGSQSRATATLWLPRNAS
jgi:hypothetical protein